MWQDIAFFSGGMIMNVSATLSALDGETNICREQSFIFCAVMVCLYAYPYSTLGLWLTVASTLYGAGVWGFNGIYRGEWVYLPRVYETLFNQ